MLAARLHEYTDEMDDGLTVEEVDPPSAENAQDVVVEIEGAGWCQTDNNIIKGLWEPYADQDLPMTLGHENAGEIVEVGSEVRTVDVGDKVICHPASTCGVCRPCRQGEDMYCENLVFPGLTTDGGFAEYLHTSERAVIKLDTLDPIDIAPHADAGITAYHAAKKAVDELDPGDYAAAIGIGGLGHIGVQALDAMSAAEIIAVDIKDEALDLAERLGADYTINSIEEDVVEEIAGITDGNGAAQALDFVGIEDTTALSPDILAAGGDHHIIGYGGHVHQPCQAFVDAEFSYRGTLVGEYTELQELVALVEQGEMDLHTTEYSLEEITDAAVDLENNDIEGRAVIVP